MGKSTISMAVSNSYVSLPEGISGETLSRILLFSTETILWSNMAAGKSTRDFPPIGNPNIATRLQYFPWSNFVVVFIPILCSKFLKKSLPKMGLPPVIIHCNGIFHHKPSSYWGISYIYIPFYGSPAWNATEKTGSLRSFRSLRSMVLGAASLAFRSPGFYSQIAWVVVQIVSNCPIRCHPIHDFSFSSSNSWFFFASIFGLWLLGLWICSKKGSCSYKQTAASGHKCMSTRGWSKKRHTLW